MAQTDRDGATTTPNAPPAYLTWRGVWGTGLSYALYDTFFYGGSSYIVLETHTSGVFATDLASGLFELMVAQGTAGAGTGDMLAANNLSEVNPAVARVNLNAALEDSEGADVAAATTTDIWVTDGNTRHITGNTTITSFGTAPQAGARMKLIFDGTPQLTQGANLNLNAGGSNITIEAGDWAEVYADTTTQFDVVVHRKSGAPIANTSGFPAGTRMTFNQTAAPTGWTKDTTAALNDSIMRIVTGTVGSGGSTAFSTFNGQTTTGAHTLTLAEIPAHTHSMSIGGNIAGNAGSTPTSTPFGTTNTGSAGSGGSHSHTMTTSIKYNDFIICQKD